MTQSLTSFAALLMFTSCATVQAPVQRALECNEFCAKYLADGDLEHAEVQCDLGLDFSPQYADLWVNKGLIALRRGEKAKAKQAFIKAVRLNPDEAQGYQNLGHLALEEKDFPSALSQFKQALRVNPDYAEARYAKALALKGMKDLPGARKAFLTVVEVNPSLADPHGQLGQMALDRKDLQEATSEFRQATLLDPQFVDAWVGLAGAHLAAGRMCEGKEALESCLDAAPEQPLCRREMPMAAEKCALERAR